MNDSPDIGALSFSAMVRRDWKNPPNLVTALRMVGAFGLPPLVMGHTQKKKVAGLISFVVLAATDKLDGWMAKNIYGSTDLGKILDPIVDKELIAVTLFSLLADAKRKKDTVMVASLVTATSVIFVREMAVAHLKLKSQQRDQQVESAIQSGRVSMVLQSVAAGALLIPVNSPTVRKVKFSLLAAAVGASLYSWREYHQKYHVPRS